MQVHLQFSDKIILFIHDESSRPGCFYRRDDKRETELVKLILMRSHNPELTTSEGAFVTGTFQFFAYFDACCIFLFPAAAAETPQATTAIWSSNSHHNYMPKAAVYLSPSLQCRLPHLLLRLPLRLQRPAARQRWTCCHSTVWWAVSRRPSAPDGYDRTCRCRSPYPTICTACA